MDALAGKKGIKETMKKVFGFLKRHFPTLEFGGLCLVCVFGPLDLR